jgi:hypothetical protein
VIRFIDFRFENQLAPTARRLVASIACIQVREQDLVNTFCQEYFGSFGPREQ